MRIACLGTVDYQNKTRIKNFIFEAMQKFGKDLTIVSGGTKDGAEKFIRKFALEMGVKYIEYNPAFTQQNLYSAMYKQFYGKKYHVSQLFQRNRLIAKNSDVMAYFLDPHTDPETINCLKEMNKMKKPVVIIN